MTDNIFNNIDNNNSKQKLLQSKVQSKRQPTQPLKSVTGTTILLVWYLHIIKLALLKNSLATVKMSTKLIAVFTLIQLIIKFQAYCMLKKRYSKRKIRILLQKLSAQNSFLNKEDEHYAGQQRNDRGKRQRVGITVENLKCRNSAVWQLHIVKEFKAIRRPKFWVTKEEKPEIFHNKIRKPKQYSGKSKISINS